MKPTHKYSIIIPHHNIPGLLSRCLDSIPQSEDIETIVVDDNSDAASVNQLQKLMIKYPNVQFIFDKQGKGAGAARNIGLAYATGKWVVFVDSDDFLRQHAKELWDKYYDTSYDIVYYMIESVYTESLKPSPKHNIIKTNYLKLKPNTHDWESWLRYKYTEPWGKLISHKFLSSHNIRFQESEVANDYYFSVKTGHLATRIAFETRAFYVYTDRENSLSKDPWQNSAKAVSRLEVYATVEKFLTGQGVKNYPFSEIAIGILLKNRQLLNDYLLIGKRHDINFIKALFRSLLLKLNKIKFLSSCH